MSQSSDHPCQNYTMLPVRGFGLAVDTAALEKDFPTAEQIAYAAMPSSVSVDIPLETEPQSSLPQARTIFTAPTDGYVWVRGQRTANATADFSYVGINMLDTAGKNIMIQGGFITVNGYQAVHLPVSKGAKVQIMFQYIETGKAWFIYCNGTVPRQ